MAGCGEDDDTLAPGVGDAPSVGREFLMAVAEGNAEAACELMTPNAVEAFEMLTSETGCEAAVAAEPGLLSLGEFTVTSEALLTALERNDLERITGTDRYRLKLPGGADITVGLLDSDDGWRVDSVLLGRTVKCGPGEVLGSDC